MSKKWGDVARLIYRYFVDKKHVIIIQKSDSVKLKQMLLQNTVKSKATTKNDVNNCQNRNS